MKYFTVISLLFFSCARYQYVDTFTLYRIYREGKENGCMIKALKVKKGQYKVKMDMCYKNTFYAKECCSERDENNGK